MVKVLAEKGHGKSQLKQCRTSNAIESYNCLYFQTEELELILRSLEGIKEKLVSPCCGINSAICGVEEEIDKAHDRFSRFAEEICINFSNLEERIIDGIEERKLSLKLSPPAEEAVYLLSIEKALPESDIYMIEAGLAIVKIRAKIKEKIGQIEKMIDEKFNEVAKAIEETEKKVPETRRRRG